MCCLVPRPSSEFDMCGFCLANLCVILGFFGGHGTNHFFCFSWIFFCCFCVFLFCYTYLGLFLGNSFVTTRHGAMWVTGHRFLCGCLQWCSACQCVLISAMSSIADSFVEDVLVHARPEVLVANRGCLQVVDQTHGARFPAAPYTFWYIF